ncbi:MAG: hypothetical protein OCD76_08410, partial [Reichenbachiella sp.]
FEAGELVAKGYIDGTEAVMDKVTTADEVVNFKVEIELSNVPISQKETDIVFVYAKAIDAKGNWNPSFDGEVSFSIIGEGELIGRNPVRSEAGIATILLKTIPGKAVPEVLAE